MFTRCPNHWAEVGRIDFESRVTVNPAPCWYVRFKHFILIQLVASRHFSVCVFVASPCLAAKPEVLSTHQVICNTIFRDGAKPWQLGFPSWAGWQVATNLYSHTSTLWFCAEFDTVWLLLCTKEDTLGYIGHDWAALSLPNFYLHFIFVASGTHWKSVSIRPVTPRQPVLIGLGDQRTEAGSLDIPGISSCFFQLRIGLLQPLQVRAAASWKSEILALLPADFPAFALETGRGERQRRCAR